MVRNAHKRATAEKFEGWLTKTGFMNANRVWHTNVILALRNCEYNPSKNSESGDHPMYRNYDLMARSAVINSMMEQAARPRLHVTLGIAAAVAFCHTHRGADPDGRFTSYSPSHASLRSSSFTLGMLYDEPYRLADGSIVIHLCHPDMNHLTSAARRRHQPDYSHVALLKAGLELAGLSSRGSP